MIRLVLCTLMFAAGLAAAPPPQSTIVSDAEIRKILVDRIDTAQQGVGIVVGVIEPAGRRIVAYGNFDRKAKRAVNGDTVFEIGSVTKVFTALLLADSVQRGEVALTDPVAQYLPPGTKVPERGGKKITLQDLATHTSGLPRLPSNFAPKDPANPYADYTVAQLYDFLATYELPRDIGAEYEYSNLGAGLLGHALSRKAGMDYETMVRTRITTPLAMKSTAITLSDAMKKRLATGHDAQLERVPNWDLPTLAGAGALRSTANDLLNFISANLRSTSSPLAPALSSMLAARRPTSMTGQEIALGWHIASGAGGREIVWHNGGTGGYRSYLGFDPKSRTGVVVLSNTFTGVGIDDIGRHLLDPTAPLLQAPKPRKEIAVDAKVLDGYAGIYELAPNFVLIVTREGNRLFAQATGQPRAELFAESDRKFFYKVVEAQITFQTDEQGRATGLTLHQNGDHPAKRVESHPAAPKQRKEIAVDPTVLERYVGRYQLAPTFIITITREGNRLFAQATAQPKFELFAETERDFFLKDVDAQITFVPDLSGRVTKAVLHQNGMDQEAKRID
jgi:D-alanyl-D-alanine-carboxypeptidase/D-alanyl-D-alanine-endopeptidase